MIKRQLAAFVVLAWLPSCSADTVTPSADSGTSSGTETSSTSGEDETETVGPDLGEVDAFITEICTAALDCTSCEAPVFASHEACVAALEPDYHDQAAAALALDLEWSPSCAADKLEWVTTACEPGQYVPCATQQCQLFVGQRSEGTPCTSGPELVTRVSDCGDGLACHEGSCYPTCSHPPVDWGCTDEYGNTCSPGESCEGDIGSSCVEQSELGGPCSGFGPSCVAGLVCDWSTEACAPPAMLGEPCSGLACNSDGFCEPETQVCEALLGNGESCESSWYCAERLCHEGVCIPVPGLGDGCEGLDPWVCEDSVCVDGVCVAEPGGGEPCTANGYCAWPFVCDEDGGMCVSWNAGLCSMFEG